MPRRRTTGLPEGVVAATISTVAEQAPAQLRKQGTWLAVEITVGAAARFPHSRGVFATCTGF